MSQSADRYEVDPCGSDSAHSFEGHASGRFCLASACGHGDRLLEGFRRHVVQEHCIRRTGEDLFQLIKGVYLDLDSPEMSDVPACAFKGLTHASG